MLVKTSIIGKRLVHRSVKARSSLNNSFSISNDASSTLVYWGTGLFYKDNKLYNVRSIKGPYIIANDISITPYNITQKDLLAFNTRDEKLIIFNSITQEELNLFPKVRYRNNPSVIFRVMRELATKYVCEYHSHTEYKGPVVLQKNSNLILHIES